MKSQISVVSLEDANDLELIIKIPSGLTSEVIYNGISYKDGDILTTSLHKYEAIRLETSADLSGTLVRGTKKVAVFNGNLNIGIADLSARDNTVSQVPPIFAWGTEYYAVPLPDDQVGASISIVSHERDTVIYVSGISPTTQTYSITEGGGVLRIDVPPAQYASIKSTKPVLVTYFTKGINNPTSTNFPSALLLPSKKQYLNTYDFTTVMDSEKKLYDTYLLLAIPVNSLDGLYLDDIPINTGGWTMFSDSSPTIVGM